MCARRKPQDGNEGPHGGLDVRGKVMTLAKAVLNLKISLLRTRLNCYSTKPDKWKHLSESSEFNDVDLATWVVIRSGSWEWQDVLSE